jgi:spore coat protein JB
LIAVNKEALMSRIQQIEFMAVELNLYLDTHPNDCRALMEYNFYTQQLNMLKKYYEQMYGPITGFGGSPSYGRWKWIDSPWPWENVHEREEHC